MTIKQRDLHYYDPLYEVLLFGDIPKQRSVRLIFHAGSGQIKLKKSIMPFLKCPEVSRLHWLKQAGFINLIFPSGSHSRFAHGLGSLHLGSIALNSITITMQDGTKTETDTLFSHLNAKGWIEEFIVALFLHDLGHYPFSHALENNLGLKKILGDDFLPHEEVACQLINGEGIIFETYKNRYKDEQKNLVSSVFDNARDYTRDIICYLISGKEKYLDRIRLSDESDMSLLKIMHDLVSGTYDLDRIDHYRRDSFFTGLGHTFKPYVLLHGLHYICAKGTPEPIEKPNPDSEGQISTLLFIRDQLHRYCFGDLRNISFGAMISHALTLHLLSCKDDKRREALTIITMTDAELLHHLMKSRNAHCRKIVNDIYLARPYPCIATFPKKKGQSSHDILQKVFDQDKEKSIILGFSKYFDHDYKPWLVTDKKVPDSDSGYVFSKEGDPKKIIDFLRKIGIVKIGYYE